jgi:uncharacterized damage-inducible protein DinB
MFTKDGVRELHSWTHQSLDLLVEHVSCVPFERLRERLVGFGISTIWMQLVHILELEEAWVHDLQDKPWPGWTEECCLTLEALLTSKQRVQNGTRTYLESLNETQLNTTLTKRPKHWVGELQSPAFILLHVVTHTFHHKGQIVAMLRTLGFPAPDTDLQRS